MISWKCRRWERKCCTHSTHTGQCVVMVSHDGCIPQSDRSDLIHFQLTLDHFVHFALLWTFLDLSKRNHFGLIVSSEYNFSQQSEIPIINAAAELGYGRYPTVAKGAGFKRLNLVLLRSHLGFWPTGCTKPILRLSPSWATSQQTWGSQPIRAQEIIVK